MNETANAIQRLKSIIAQAAHEVKVLNIRGRNSISSIRSLLDALNLSPGEDVTELKLENAKVEFDELMETAEKIKTSKGRLKEARKELSEIERSVKW